MLELARAAAGADGAYPLSEQVVLHLRHHGEFPALHLLVREPSGRLRGYAQLDPTDQVGGMVAELVVHPRARRHGLGGRLVQAMIEIAGQRSGGRLRVWAHGDHPAATALARAHGFTRGRVLYQMRRSLLTPIPAAVLPEGVSLRAFRPDGDEPAWLALNARAFAEHPEQGRWTEPELRLRMAEPWFDPEGFLLAERAGRLLGFHWTKVHDETPQHPPIGEVYVLGVDPEAHGSGLGKALTLAGLRHLRGRGLEQAMLYVDESNLPAVALYTGLGFARWTVDVMFHRTTARIAARFSEIGLDDYIPELRDQPPRPVPFES